MLQSLLKVEPAIATGSCWSKFPMIFKFFFSNEEISGLYTWRFSISVKFSSELFTIYPAENCNQYDGPSSGNILSLSLLPKYGQKVWIPSWGVSCVYFLQKFVFSLFSWCSVACRFRWCFRLRISYAAGTRLFLGRWRQPTHEATRQMPVSPEGESGTSEIKSWTRCG